jgi:hypothetical protein
MILNWSLHAIYTLRWIHGRLSDSCSWNHPWRGRLRSAPFALTSTLPHQVVFCQPYPARYSHCLYVVFQCFGRLEATKDTIDADLSSNALAENPTFHCTVFDKSYLSSKTLLNHESAKHGPNRLSFACSVCGKT